MMNEEKGELLRAKINGETSRMPWSELVRFHASGAVIAVSNELDLVDVAYCIACDDKDAVMHWMAENRIVKVSDEEAKAWLAADLSLWAVVIKPWILVQMEKAH
jgi:hypothetical protein